VTLDDPPRDDLLHACAFEAFVQAARETRGWPPSEAVEARAYELYEAESREKSGG
jgi:hypothetical protein